MPSYRDRLRVVVVALVATCGFSGCVERRYTIRTDPPGAMVVVNGEEIGRSPVSRSFTFYGDRSIRIIKEGYETKEVVQPMKAPWFDNLATEFFTENLVPYTFRDDIEFNYKLEPSQLADTQGVLDRAQATRAEGQGPPKKRRTGILGFLGF